MQLSPTLQEKVGYVVQKIIEELKESGICIKEIHTE
jgi:Ni,Fe-hydrogenase maturation factor